METSTISKLKERATKFIQTNLLRAGTVLDVRHWPGGEMTEIDLHLPESSMTDWTEVPYIKIRVGNFLYRDYTPFGWDADTRTCSLLVDTGHDGPGSRWAQNISIGETVHYVKETSSRQSPHPTDLVVGLGDASSIAHLLALQQLTLPDSRFDGAVLLNNEAQRGLFADYFRSPLSLLASESDLAKWLEKRGYCTDHTYFYLTGNNHLVGRIRAWLRSTGHKNIKAKGFWS